MRIDFEILYEHIGYLLYALASESHILSSYESNKLNKLIDKHWKISDPTEAALHARLNEHLHTGMQKAMGAGWNSNQAFSAFKDFYFAHSLSFGHTLRENIEKCSEQILRDYYRLPSDSKIFTELKWLLKSHANSSPIPPYAKISRIC